MRGAGTTAAPRTRAARSLLWRGPDLLAVCALLDGYRVEIIERPAG